MPWWGWVGVGVLLATFVGGFIGVIMWVRFNRDWTL